MIVVQKIGEIETIVEISPDELAKLYRFSLPETNQSKKIRSFIDFVLLQTPDVKRIPLDGQMFPIVREYDMTKPIGVVDIIAKELPNPTDTGWHIDPVFVKKGAGWELTHLSLARKKK